MRRNCNNSIVFRGRRTLRTAATIPTQSSKNKSTEWNSALKIRSGGSMTFPTVPSCCCGLKPLNGDRKAALSRSMERSSGWPSLLLTSDPHMHAARQHIHRECPCTQHLVVKRANVELLAQLVLRFLAQFENLQLPDLVAERLA